MEGFIHEQALQKSKARKLVLAAVGVLAVVVLVGVAFNAKADGSLTLSEIQLEHEEFAKFMRVYGKSYRSQPEFEKRFQVFKDNLALIRLHNAQDKDVVLAVNKFADMTNEEFKSLFTQKKIEQKLMSTPAPQSMRAPPPTVDWRDQGAVTDVKHQSFRCHSSWAFASAGAVEGAWKIAGHELADLSAQQILDCTNTTTSAQCAGGLISDALQYVNNSGLTSDVIYPYTGQNNTCNTVAAGNTVASIISFAQVPLGNMTYAVADQPVAAAVEADQYVWQFYYSGVIYKYCGTNVNHDVLVVGYNITGQYQYLICKNSWGPDWGESGYVRISIYGGQQGVCGINTAAYYAVGKP